MGLAARADGLHSILTRRAGHERADGGAKPETRERRGAAVSRLAAEGSPYLQQHADNPVDWWPWGEEAFEEARRRDVPVFLSIGYATCHWCHVMAHESFEDEQVARLMNEAFVCIKVDREERPDVDDVYMAACHAMGQRGGWPLTAMLDHDKRPWFTGTYFPKTSIGQRVGMVELVPGLSEAWKDKRADIEAQGKHLVDHLRPRPTKGAIPKPGLLRNAAEGLLGREDKEFGGFGQAPKFPSLHQIRLLLAAHRQGHTGALAAARRQLDAIANGGIRDHAGGGLHRYSTDRRWHLPHFEKMLYDQGNALWAYAEAYTETQEPAYLEMLEDIATYLERDMRHDSGAFFAAEDADSEGEEGLFYTWTWAQLCSAVGKPDATALGGQFEGNFDDESTRKPSGRNIPFTADAEVRKRTRPGLLAVREKRVRPLRDEKILADWNGLAISGLAAAARETGNARFKDLAVAAADGTWNLLFHDGHLRHSYTAGQAKEPWFLEDQAAMALGLLHLYEVSHRVQDMERALTLLGTFDAFASEAGTLYRTPTDGEPLPMRGMDLYDGASPSGNALAAAACLHAARLTGNLAWDERAQDILSGAGTSLAKQPLAHTAMVVTVDELHLDWLDVVIAGPDPTPFLEATQGIGPGVHVLVWDGKNGLDKHVEFLPAVTDKTVAYVCRGDACETPLDTPAALRERLESAE